MSGVVAIPAAEIRPQPGAVLGSLGVPASARVSAAVAPVLDEAFARFLDSARPRALVRRVAAAELAAIYAGEGDNAPDTPLERVVPRAEALALFVLTLGGAVTEEIGRLTSAHDYPAAATLDAVASLAADAAVQALENRFADRLEAAGSGTRRPAVLAYSPGYCGWHLSGQRRLLAALDPGRIGVSLGPSCLMLPLKSVSGVLVAGEAAIHDVEPGFDFCSECASMSCRLRVERLRAAAAG